jgi:hypothetical protein
MTDREEIIRMAREAGASTLHGGEAALFGDAAIERFAALHEQYLISQGYRKCAKGQRTTQFCGLLEDAVQAEREACADIASTCCEGCADDIRARGQ